MIHQKNDNDLSGRVFFKVGRKIILFRSVNYDLTKLICLTNKMKTKTRFQKKTSEDVNFDISEIDDIEK